MKISTKTGDKGYTGLFTGRRLKKSELIFDVMGDFDELSSFLGMCKSAISASDSDTVALVDLMQDGIYRIQSVVGNEMAPVRNIREIDLKDVLVLEQQIEKLEENVGEMKEFVFSGNNEASARFHVARTICRRAERSLVKFCEEAKVGEYILQYANRLSDLLFLLACKFASMN